MALCITTLSIMSIIVTLVISILSINLLSPHPAICFNVTLNVIMMSVIVVGVVAHFIINLEPMLRRQF
jgi:hypothetical protein